MYSRLVSSIAVKPLLNATEKKNKREKKNEWTLQTAMVHWLKAPECCTQVLWAFPGLACICAYRILPTPVREEQLQWGLWRQCQIILLMRCKRSFNFSGNHQQHLTEIRIQTSSLWLWKTGRKQHTIKTISDIISRAHLGVSAGNNPSDDTCHLGHLTHWESTVLSPLLSVVLLSHAHVLVLHFKAFFHLLCAFDIHIYRFRYFDIILHGVFCWQYSLEND